MTTSSEWLKVKEYLSFIGLERYQEIFETKGYDTLFLVNNLSNEDLDILGITKEGHRKALLKVTINSPAPVRRELSEGYWKRAFEPPTPSRKDLPFNKDTHTETEGSKDFRILLVRHGQSEANINKLLYTQLADHAVPLSKYGKIQAAEAGNQIKLHFEKVTGSTSPPENWYCRIWTSPYLRARETATLLMDNAGGWISDIRESIFLVEQQFGLFEGKDWYNNGLEGFPQELEYYQKCSKFGGRFWAKIPLGESRFDVCSRVYQSFGTLHRDASVGIKNVIIVSHGVTLRAWMMMWLRLKPEWFEEEKNPSNCAIRLIEGGIDRKFVWGGYESHHRPDLLLTQSDQHKEA
eukprot:TRINITY_DN8433_c0_g1_i1.p1 TRINITY_DN8433_c0_g1~~TRINITY_DN8433_c0_g1_i1.p1  ORF type:complete len:350 (-),score=55.99 TRINITY_DN8433_c0_g1_i1:131-1180(-)